MIARKKEFESEFKNPMLAKVSKSVADEHIKHVQTLDIFFDTSSGDTAERDHERRCAVEAGEHEYDALMDEFDPPKDWDSPDWDKPYKVHNWHNHVPESIKQEWSSFNGRQRIKLARMFQDIADLEELD